METTRVFDGVQTHSFPISTLDGCSIHCA